MDLQITIVSNRDWWSVLRKDATLFGTDGDSSQQAYHTVPANTSKCFL